MANIASKIKSAQKNLELRRKNNAVKSSIRTTIKKTLNPNFEITEDTRKENFRIAQKKLAKAVSKGVLHKNTAARKTSRLALNLNKMLNSTTS